MITIDKIQNGTIYITGDEKLEYLERVQEKQCETGKLFIARTSIDGIYTYGLEQTLGSYFGHGPGYIWSSRASVINSQLGTVLYEAAYREGDRGYRSCAVDLIRFEDILKAHGYKIDLSEPEVSSDGLDIHYKVEKISE